MADKKAVIATRCPSLAVTLWSRRRNVFQNSSYQLQNKLFAVQKGRNRVSVINQVFFRGKFPAEQQQNNNGEVKGTQNLNKLQRYLLHLQIVTSTIEKEIMGAAAIKIQGVNQTSSCLPFFPVFFIISPSFIKSPIEILRKVVAFSALLGVPPVKRRYKKLGWRGGDA